MNPDFIQNSIINRDPSYFTKRNLETNFNVYTSLKETQSKKHWDKVFNPFNLKVPLLENKINHYGLPFTHGNFNNIQAYNTYFNHENYIAPSYRTYEMYPPHGVIYSVIKKRSKGVYL